MVEEYDHRYVRVCHTKTGLGTKLTGEHWRDPNGCKQPVHFEECEPVRGFEREPHYQADVSFDFWDVRCVLPITTLVKDTDFEVRKFTLCLPQQTFTNWHEWLKADHPVMSDIGEEHLVAQFVLASACKPEDLCRQHIKLVKQIRKYSNLEEAKATWVKSRQPRSDYMQEFLGRCRTVLTVPERSRQPEENPHIKPKGKKKSK